jgi:hypothetical protein
MSYRLLLIAFNEYSKCCCNVGIFVVMFSTLSHTSSIKLPMLFVYWRSWCYVLWEVGKSSICGRLCSSLGCKFSRVGKFVTRDPLYTPWKLIIFQTIAPSGFVG